MTNRYNAAGHTAAMKHIEGSHTFVITVTVEGHGCGWAEELVHPTVEARSLSTALRLAAESPLSRWSIIEDDGDDGSLRLPPHDRPGAL